MKVIQNLNIAGYISIGSAIVTIPVILMSFYSGYMEGMGETKNIVFYTTELAVTFIYLLMFVVVLQNLKYLLNNYQKTSSLDSFITLILWANIVLTLMPILLSPFNSISDMVSIITLVFLLPYGIIIATFYYKIYKLECDLFGWKRSFAITGIIMGACFATLVLLPLGLIASIVLDLILAIIFFKAYKSENLDLIHS